jgi:zinc protease
MNARTLMNRALATAVLALAIAGASMAAPAPAVASGFPYTPKVVKLDNGLTVALVPFDAPGLVAYYTLVRAGSRNEVEPGHTGFAHFFEHMMFRAKDGEPDFSDQLSRLGWSTNAWTYHDQTVYTDFGPTDGLMDVIDLEAKRFQSLEYSESAFRTEAGAVLGEYNKSAAAPWMKLSETLQGTAFTKHTYRHTTMGFIEDIKAMPEKYEYSLRFFERFYRPDNVVIYVVGDFDEAATLERVRAAYGAWSGKTARPEIPAEPAQDAERRAHIDWDGQTLSRAIFAWRAPPASDYGAVAAQEVLYAYLFGETSPLHRSLVLEKQIAQPFTRWGGGPHRDPFVFAVLGTAKAPEHLGAVEEAALASVAKVAAGEIEAERVERIQSNARYSMLMGLEDPQKVASLLVWWASTTGDLKSVEAVMAAIAAVTPAQLTEYAKTWMTEKGRTVITLKPAAAPPPAAQPAAGEGAK